MSALTPPVRSEPGDYPREVRERVDYEESRKALMTSLRRMCIVSVLDEVAVDVDGAVVDLREHRAAASMLRRVIEWPGLEPITLGELRAVLDAHDAKARQQAQGES